MKINHQLQRLFWLMALPLAILASCGGSGDDPTPAPKPDKPDHGGSTGELNIVDGNNLYGVVKDNAGKGVKDVVVTDGYNVVTTDAQGVYQMKRNSKAEYVYYTNPKGYQPDNNGFYKELDSKTQRYDFTLGSVAGDDTHFTLLLLTDPQVRSTSSYRRFLNETMPAMKQTISAAGMPVVGWSLGDDVHEGHPEFEKGMHDNMTGMGIPFFSVPGNHDYFKINGSDSKPRSCDRYKQQWGPIWYSFNKGDVHFIGINNVVYSSGDDYNDSGVIDAATLAWMKKDLSHVDKSKLVIVGYHIPMTYKKADNGRNAMILLLKDFPNRLLMCGHTHYMRHRVTTDPLRIEERIHSAGCGAFWWSNINKDGTPNGFSIYEIKGNEIVNNKWINSNAGMPDNIRVMPGDYSHGDFSYDLSKNYVVANVWNWDPEWKVTISVDGGAAQDMEQGLDHSPKVKYDAWSDGYLIGNRGRAQKSFQAYNEHLFLFRLSNPDSKFIVTAKDRYGNIYTANSFTTSYAECLVDGKDYTPAKGNRW